MKTALLALGTTVIHAIWEFLKSTGGKIAVSIPIVLILLTIIPYEIKLPQEVVNILTSDLFVNLMRSITFLFPVNFALSCLLILLLSKHSSIFAKIIAKIFRIFRGGSE